MPSQKTPIKHRLLQLAALASYLILLSGCKILIQVPAGARVVSDNFECTAGAICEIDVTTTNFNEAFIVEPEPGYQFAGWRKAWRHLCGGSSSACAIDTSGFVGQPALLAFLNNDEIFYLEPQIVPKNPSISGKLTYDRVPQLSDGRGLDYNNINRMPIRGATVQLLRNSDSQVLEETISSSDGAYAFTVDSQDEVFVRVRAELLRKGTPDWNLTVRDNTQSGALYVLDGAQATINDAAPRNLHAPSGWGGSRYNSERTAAPFALLDTMYGAQMRLVEIDLDISLPPLKYFGVKTTAQLQAILPMATFPLASTFASPVSLCCISWASRTTTQTSTMSTSLSTNGYTTSKTESRVRTLSAGLMQREIFWISGWLSAKAWVMDWLRSCWTIRGMSTASVQDSKGPSAFQWSLQRVSIQAGSARPVFRH